MQHVVFKSEQNPNLLYDIKNHIKLKLANRLYFGKRIASHGQR